MDIRVGYHLSNYFFACYISLFLDVVPFYESDIMRTGRQFVGAKWAVGAAEIFSVGGDAVP